MKKRMAALLVCLVMVLSMGLTGCGGSESVDDLSDEDYDRSEFVYIAEDGSKSDFKALAGSTQEATLTWDWSVSDTDYIGYTFEMECNGKTCTIEFSGYLEEDGLDEIYNVQNGSLAELEEGDIIEITFDSSYYSYDEEEDGAVYAYLLIDSVTIE